MKKEFINLIEFISKNIIYYFKGKILDFLVKNLQGRFLKHFFYVFI